MECVFLDVCLILFIEMLNLHNLTGLVENRIKIS